MMTILMNQVRIPHSKQKFENYFQHIPYKNLSQDKNSAFTSVI